MFYELLPTLVLKYHEFKKISTRPFQNNSPLHKCLMKENLEPSSLKNFLALHKTLKV